MIICYTWHDEERKPRNRAEDHTPHSFSLSFSLTDPEALHGIKEAIEADSGIPARWIKIDSASTMTDSTGKPISKAVFLGYMNHYAYIMRELGWEYAQDDEYIDARNAWNNLYTISTAYGITTAEAVSIRESPNPRYWESPKPWNWAAE